MKRKFVFLIGDGRRARFWGDRWCEDDALSVFFPFFVHVGCLKKCVGDGSLGFFEGVGGWNTWFSRPFND